MPLRLLITLVLSVSIIIDAQSGSLAMSAPSLLLPADGAILPQTAAYKKCLAALLGIERADRWVEHAIPGLYQAVSLTPIVSAGAMRFRFSTDEASLLPSVLIESSTSLLATSKFRGIQGHYNPDRRSLAIFTVYLSGSKGEEPRFPKMASVSGLPAPWNKAIPTGVFAFLFLMKHLRIPFGGLNSVTVIQIIEPQTGMELALFPRIDSFLRQNHGPLPKELVADSVSAVQMGRLVSTAMIQSGHRILSVQVGTWVDTKPLSWLVEETYVRPHEPTFRHLVDRLGYDARIPGDFSMSYSLDGSDHRWELD